MYFEKKKKTKRNIRTSIYKTAWTFEINKIFLKYPCLSTLFLALINIMQKYSFLYLIIL